MLSSWYLGRFVSPFACYVLPALSVGLSTLTYALRARTLRKQTESARRALDAETETLDVGDTVLHGAVEYAEGADYAMRTTVEQAGSEAESSGSWTVTWEETRRFTEVVPFYVVHDSKVRVRVEPGKRAVLATNLLVGTRIDLAHRTRTAYVSPTAEVWVTGKLERGHDPESRGGYRDGTGWVMRPPPYGEMLVTTYAPETDLARSAKHARVFVWLMGILLVATMLAHTDYHALVASGRPATATVTGKHISTSDDGPDTYTLELDVHDGTAHFADTWDVDYSTYDHAEKGTSFGALASFGFETSLLGDHADALGTPSVVTFVVWAVLSLIGLLTARKRHWYDGEKVKDTESGQLKDGFTPR